MDKRMSTEPEADLWAYCLEACAGEKVTCLPLSMRNVSAKQSLMREDMNATLKP